MLFRGVNLTLQAGGALLVAGANGSGKSSLLRLLAGLLRPVGGVIAWQDRPIMADLNAYQANIHWLGHHTALKPELSVGEMLCYWRALLGIKHSLPTEPLMARLGLEHLLTQPVRLLSAGQQRRLGLARLLLERRPLWLLDEPLTALDSTHQHVVGALVVEHRAAGGILIMASHQAVSWPELQTLTLGDV